MEGDHKALGEVHNVLTPRERALLHRPWRHSTGPRSEAGKASSSKNSLRHGRETAARREFRRESLRFLRGLDGLLRDLREREAEAAADRLRAIFRQAEVVGALLDAGADRVERPAGS